MKFHLALFSLTLTLKGHSRSHRFHTGFQWPISPNLFKITIVFDLK